MWTDRQDQTLIEMWQTGHSAGQISEVLKERSRNAVIGRVNRLRLGGADLPARPRRYRLKKPAVPHEPRRPHSTSARIRPVPRPPRVLAEVPSPVVILRAGEVEPDGTHVGLMQLSSAGCKWPVTRGGPHLFCNKLRRGNFSYCDEHTLKGTLPPREWRGR